MTELTLLVIDLQSGGNTNEEICVDKPPLEFRHVDEIKLCRNYITIHNPNLMII